jgi:hypothetical protein
VIGKQQGEWPSNINVPFDVDMDWNASAGRACLMVAKSCELRGLPLAKARRIGAIMDKLNERPTMRYSLLLDLDRLLPGALGQAERACRSQVDLKTMCRAGLPTHLFMYMFGALIENDIIDELGEKEAVLWAQSISKGVDAMLAARMAAPRRTTLH